MLLSFSLLSADFLAQKIDIDNNITPINYTVSRIKKFYPHYLFSFLAIFFFRNLIIYKDYSIGSLVEKLANQTTEIFMLYGTILSDKKTFIYNSMTWYISVMLIVGYILWGLVQKHKNSVVFIAPIISFWIYAYMYYELGTVNNWRDHVFEIFNYGFLRATAGMLLGLSTYQLSVFLKNKIKSRKIFKFMIYFGLLALSVAFAMSYQWFKEASFAYIVFFLIGVAFITAGESGNLRPPPIYKWLAKRFSKWCYAIYLNHYLVMFFIKKFIYVKYSFMVIPCYLAILFLYSMFTTYIVNKFVKLSSQMIERWENNILKEAK